jgi:hypothetical protein
MSGHHTYRILTLIGLAWLIASPVALAQQAFNDSIAALSVRVEERLAGQERMRITVLDLTDPSGRLGKELITYVEEVLIMHLSQRPRITVLERRALDQVLEEQRRTASGTFDEEGAIEIGRLMAADALITGSIFRVDGRMHLILRLLAPIRRRHVVYSCAVGHDDPLALPGLLLDLAGKGDAAEVTGRLEILFHDYFPLSPAYTLLDADGLYRGPLAPESMAARAEGSHGLSRSGQPPANACPAGGRAYANPCRTA